MHEFLALRNIQNNLCGQHWGGQSQSLLEFSPFSSLFEEFPSAFSDDLLFPDPLDFGCFNDDVRKFSVDPVAFDVPAVCADVLDFGDVLLVVDGDGLRDREVRWLNFSKLDCLDDVGTCDCDALAAFSAANAFLDFFKRKDLSSKKIVRNWVRSAFFGKMSTT